MTAPAEEKKKRKKAIRAYGTPRRHLMKSELADGVIVTRGGVDRILLGLIIVLVILGSVMVFSASYPYALSKYKDSLYFIKKQALFVALGSVVLYVAAQVP